MKIKKDTAQLRGKANFVFDRVPNERMDQYLQQRQYDQSRDYKFMHKLFPALEGAKEQYMGQKESDRSPNRKLHSNEVIKFSDVVYNLAQEREPHPARVTFNQSPERDSSRYAAESPAPGTVSSAVKDKYFLRSQHSQIGRLKFIPPSRLMAKEDIKSDFPYSLGDSIIEYHLKEQ